jgi:APA family basic amino acid/polyamine antiporter
VSKPAQQIGLTAAVAIGFASMLGAGVFAVFRDATALAQNYIYLAVLLAGLVATLNAASVYQLARAIDRPGGIYAYSRVYLHPRTSFTAGFAFVFGKIASIAAIAMVVGEYLDSSHREIVAAITIAILTAVNILGINRTAAVATVLASATVAYLLVTLTSGFAWLASPASNQRLTWFASSLDEGTFMGLLQAASVLFFAFAGYARVATLGNEVRNAKRNIPRAIAISLVAVLAIYLLLCALLVTTFNGNLASTETPLLTLNLLTINWLPAALTIGISKVVTVAACLGSMLALLAGVSRTAATMAEDRELPKAFAARNRFGSPWLSEVLIAGGAALLAQTQSLAWVVGFSSFSVLLYYGIGHITVMSQPAAERRLAPIVPAAGLALCFALAICVPGPAVWVSILIIAAALLVRRFTR